MKRLILLLTLALFTLAPTYTDQLDADFLAGITSGTNISAGSVVLNSTNGTFLSSGQYFSSVKNLGSNPTGTLSWVATSPTGTSILVSTRSGPTPTISGSWSAFSPSYAASGDPLQSPQDQYYQYRLELATTDNTTTPAVTSVIVLYNENGPNITAATGFNTPLNDQSIGSFIFNAFARDTVPVTSVQSRYRIGSDPYSSYSAMNDQGSDRYQITIPQPAGGWITRTGELLYIEVNASNANQSNTQVFTDLIDSINDAPVMNPVPNLTATERQSLLIAFSGSDPDGDNLSFQASRGTVTSTGTTTALWDWAPPNNETGMQTVIASVNDGSLADAITIYVNVTPVNDIPRMQTTPGISGYYGDQFTVDFVVLDNDTNDNITFSVNPPLFRVELYNYTNGTEYVGRANIVALDNFRGNRTVNVSARDTQYETSVLFNSNIAFCGDLVCQDQENSTSCSSDCQTTDTPEYISLEIPPRICVGEQANFTTYNASSRFTCNSERRTFEGAALCEPIDGVDIELYTINENELRQETGSISSNQEGIASFTPTVVGRYKLITSKTDLVGAEHIITVQNCSADIRLLDRVVEFSPPVIELEEFQPEIPPELQRPEGDVQETSLLAILIWYIFIPLLGALLLYTGNVYYELHKDSDPRILTARIWLWQQGQKLAPVINPYKEKLLKALEPLKPVWQKITQALKPVGDMAGKIIEKIAGR